MKPTRNDLRVVIDTDIAGYPVHKEITDEELAAMGLVQAPECGECGGTGEREGYHDGKCRCRGQFHVCRSYVCPKCGGSGYGRLVSLDVDVEALREALAWQPSKPDFGRMRPEEITAYALMRKQSEEIAVWRDLTVRPLLRQVLAALSNGHSTVATEASPSVTLDREDADE